MTTKEMFAKLQNDCKRANVRCEYCELDSEPTMCAHTDCRTGWFMYWIAVEQMFKGEYC